MSSAQGFVKANAPWRDPLKTIKGKKCAIFICRQTATCAVLTTKVRGACDKHGKRAQELGYDVVFPNERT